MTRFELSTLVLVLPLTALMAQEPRIPPPATALDVQVVVEQGRLVVRVEKGKGSGDFRAMEFVARIGGEELRGRSLLGGAKGGLVLGPCARTALLKGEVRLPIEVELRGTRKSVMVDLDQLLAICRVELASESAGARLRFWRTVAERARQRVASDLVAKADAEAAANTPPVVELGGVRLTELASADAATQALVRDEEKSATMPDGVVVDWSVGKLEAPPLPVARLELAAGTVTAGKPVEFDLEVQNQGKGPTHRLLAVTAGGGILSGYPILFGAIPAGGQVVRKVQIPTAETQTAAEVEFSLVFVEQDDFVPERITAKVQVLTAPQPELGVWCIAVDGAPDSNSAGNGDGVVQKGESIELQVTVKNNGQRAAEDVILELAIDAAAGLKVLGERRPKLGRIEPGRKVEHKLAIAVQQGFTGQKVAVVAKVNEQSPFRRSLEQDLSMKVGEKAGGSPIALNRQVQVKSARAPLLSAADVAATNLGYVEAGSVLLAVAEIGDYVQAEYADEGGKKRRAWMSRQDLSFDIAKAEAPAVAAAGAVVREFVVPPPQVVVVSPSSDVVTTDKEQYPLDVRAEHGEGIKEIVVRQNGRTLPPVEAGRGASIEPAGPSKSAGVVRRQVQETRDLVLAPGDNVIEIEAVDVKGGKSVRTLKITRSLRHSKVVAVVVGIDGYQDGAIPEVKYGQRDAEAFAEFLRSERGLVRDAANLRLLVGKDATRLAVLSAIEEVLVKGAAHPEDMAILYFAGHGFVEGERMMFACYDTVAKNKKPTSLTDAELQSIWGELKAERRVLVVDACHAAGMVSGRLKELVDATTVKFLAAAADQRSIPSDEFQHGVFTYALLNGLRGAADLETGDRDGKVTDKELAAFLERQVPLLARKLEHVQTPFCTTNPRGALALTQ